MSIRYNQNVMLNNTIIDNIYLTSRYYVQRILLNCTGYLFVSSVNSEFFYLLRAKYRFQLDPYTRDRNELIGQ